MSGEAKLEALLEIITTSTRQAIAEYKKGDNEVPTIDSKTYHPADCAIDTIALRKAVRLLEGACQQLCASLAPPQHTVVNFSLPSEWACLRVVLHAKIADALEEHPMGLHLDELSKMVDLDKKKLARVLRLLATKGCFTEVKPNVFSNNRISLVTLSRSETSALLKMLVDNISQGAAVLYETMIEPEYARSHHPERAPIIYALRKKGLEGNFFDVLKGDAERREEYQRAMVGGIRILGSLSILYYYPWNKVKTICDVGSGIGAVSLPLSKMHPHLKIMDQDLPEVLIQAKDVWSKEAPQALETGQVEFVPINFLEQSPVPGQDVYYLHNIIHDWPDAEAAIILGNIKEAMASHSRLLLHGTVLTPISRDSDSLSYGLDVAPEPLLRNFGNTATYSQDLIMWCVHNAKERTLDELAALGSAAGLQLEMVYDLANTAVLEFKVSP